MELFHFVDMLFSSIEFCTKANGTRIEIYVNETDSIGRQMLMVE